MGHAESTQKTVASAGQTCSYLPNLQLLSVTKCLMQKWPNDIYLYDCIFYAADIFHEVCGKHLENCGRCWPNMLTGLHPPNLQPSSVTDPTFHLQCVSWGKLRGEEKGGGDMFWVLATSYPASGGPVRTGTVYCVSMHYSTE